MHEVNDDKSWTYCFVHEQLPNGSLMLTFRPCSSRLFSSATIMATTVVS